MWDKKAQVLKFHDHIILVVLEGIAVLGSQLLIIQILLMKDSNTVPNIV